MLSRIKKLFASEQQQLRADEAREFLETRLGKEIIIAKERLKAQLKTVMKEYSALRKLYAELALRDAKAGFPNSVKAKLCRRALELLDVEEPAVDYNDIMDFLRLSEKNLKSIGAFSYKEMIHLYAFKDDMNRIAGQTKTTIEALNALAGEADKSLLKEISKAEKCIEKIEGNRALRQKLVSDIENLDRAAEEKRKILEDEVKSLKEFSSVEEEIRGLRKDIDNTESEMNFLESKISEEFSGTERVFKKHRHTTRKKGIIDDYIKNATNAFLVIDKELQLKDILEHIVEEKELENDKGFEKLLQLRRDIGLLSPLREQHLSLKEKKGELGEELLRLSSKASDKEYRLQDIKETESEIKKLEREKTEKENEIKSVENTIKTDTQLLASLLNNFTGQKVVVAE